MFGLPLFRPTGGNRHHCGRGAKQVVDSDLDQRTASVRAPRVRFHRAGLLQHYDRFQIAGKLGGSISGATVIPLRDVPPLHNHASLTRCIHRFLPLSRPPRFTVNSIGDCPIAAVRRKAGAAPKEHGMDCRTHFLPTKQPNPLVNGGSLRFWT